MRQDRPFAWLGAAVGAAARRVAGAPPGVARQDREVAEAAMLRSVAACLEPRELEDAILDLLVTAHPGTTALVSLDGASAKPSRFDDGGGARSWNPADATPPLLAVPISEADQSFGWLAYVENDGLRAIGAAAAKHLLAVAHAASVPARNVKRHAAALDLSLRDPLTGLFNRRAFEAFLEQEAERARREFRPLALIVLDLDRFKEVNDTLGHPAGDEALRRTARTLMTSTRRSDVVARLGGDEFALLLPSSDAKNAKRLGRRILAALDAKLAAFDLGLAGPSPSASLGVAELAESGGDAKRLVELADAAQIRAKRLGGGRVERPAPCSGGSTLPPMNEEVWR